MSTGIEIELKFQLPQAQRTRLERALATRSAERLPLRAMYFDTPDARLAAAQMALRLRREGARWVQTLKARGDGLMQRLEHEVPVAGDGEATPALELDRHDGSAAGRALARALRGGEPPELLYRTDIERLRRVVRSGATQVEVALDVGVIRAGERSVDVCEVEFELLRGPLSGLLDLAARWAARYGLVLDVTTKAERGHRLAAGDPPPPVVQATPAALRKCMRLDEARAALVTAALAHALPNAAALIGPQGRPEHLHQLRVALRRLRTALRAFGPEDAARDIALHTLFETLGQARDSDVLAETLAPAWAAAAAAGLVPGAEVPAADAQARAAAALRTPEAAALWLELIGLAQGPAAARHGDAAQSDDARPWGPVAERLWRRWRRQARHLARDWHALALASRHRLRKRLKRLRYLLEFCAPLWPGKTSRRQLAALRSLQDRLGRWNDLMLASAHLAARPRSDAAAQFAAGWLAREARLRDRECAAAAATWRGVPAP